MASEAALPLQRFTVLDLTEGRAGAYGVRQLADWGARVIRIEPPSGARRSVGTSREEPSGSAWADRQNLRRNTQSVTLDVARPAGRALLMRLIAGADALADSLTPAAAAALGLDGESLRAANSRLVHGRVTAFGAPGPYAERPATDAVVQAFAGLMSVTGEPGLGPLRVGIPLAELAAGLYLAQGMLAALFERERPGQRSAGQRGTGRGPIGRLVQTSLLEALLALLDFQAARWLLDGEVPGQAGNAHPTLVPTGVARTRDGFINYAASRGPMYLRFMKALGLERLLQDPRFRDEDARLRHRAAMNAELEPIFARRDSAEWLAALAAAEVPCGPILSLEEALGGAQAQHLGIVAALPAPGGGELKLVRPAVQLARTPGLLRTPAPAPSAHTEEVLTEARRRGGEVPSPAAPQGRIGSGRDAPSASTGYPGSALPLAGIKVLDLTYFRAGPNAARQLADWGADVVKVELPPALDDGRSGVRDGSDYQNTHRNKRSITLDLKAPAGKALFLRLAAGADVVLENFRPDVKHRLGLDDESLRRHNPRLIYGSISGFGQSGPERDRAGLDQIAQGVSGLMASTGEAQGEPMRAGTAVGDLTAGLLLAQGILIALLEREVSGQGQWVHTSLLEAMLALLDGQAARLLLAGEPPRRTGNDDPDASPAGTVSTADGHLAFAAGDDAAFGSLCALLSLPALAADARFAGAEARLRNRAHLMPPLEAAFAREGTAAWSARLTGAGIPCAPVQTLEGVFGDQHVRALGMAPAVTHPRLGPQRLVAHPVTVDGARLPLRRASPDPGADNAEVYGALGLTSTEIEALRRKHVI
ncbi:MAG: CoA transferase [Candidatus Lambdaproteobacteria bacterium]|nr:CoA transferase [Candidatus Lambdaproteobacteria bacterium]